MQLVGVELAFPAADHHGGDAVADEIGQRAAFAHELVDAEDDGDRLDRDIRHDGERGGERDEAGAGDAGRALRRQHGDHQNAHLLAERDRRVGGLRQEQRRQGHIDVGAIEIEAIAGRDHEPHDRFRGAEAFHFLDHVRQHRLRRTGAEHDQQFVLDVADEAQDREAGEIGDGSEHDQHEQGAGQVERRDQLQEVDQRAEPIGADGERHGAERADRRHAHDDADDAEEHLCGGIDRVVDLLADRTQAGDHEAGENRHQQHLQDVAAGQRTEEAVGDDPQQMADDAFLLGRGDVTRHRLGIERRRIDVESLAGLQQLANDQPDGERDGGNSLEIKQRLDADAADLAEIAHRADAVHHGAEDHRRDHHLDQRDEGVAQGLHRHAGLGKVISKRDAERDGDQHLDVQHGVPGTPLRRGNGTRHGDGPSRFLLRLQLSSLAQARKNCRSSL